MALTNGVKLTLYKFCRFNDKYENVMSQIKGTGETYSPFEKYLNSLGKYEVEIDEAYQDSLTSFNFYLSTDDYLSIFLFNYMKIESIKSGSVVLTRYAFISSINIMNELATVNYKLDIWHSFYLNISGINKSYLSGFRISNAVGGVLQPTYYNLPIDYEGNNNLTLPIPTYGGTQKCYIIIEFQRFNTQEYGNSSYSDVRYLLLNKRCKLTDVTTDSSGNISSGKITEVNDILFDDVDNVIANLQNFKKNKSWSSNDLNVNTIASASSYFYDIANIYVIPYITNTYLDTKLSTVAIGFYGQFVAGDSGTAEHTFFGGRYLQYGNDNVIIQYSTKTLNNDFKRKSVGIFTVQIPIISNGTSITFRIDLSLSRTSFKLFLSCQNKYIDITKEFSHTILFNQANGDVLAQQKISRTIANLKDITDIVGISGKTAIGANIGNLNYIRGQNMEDYYSSIFAEKGTGQIGLMSGLTSKLVAETGIVGLGISAVTSIANLSLKRLERNSPVYNSSSIVYGNNIDILNCKYWLTEIKITSDNDNYVKSSINNMGYNVYEYITSWLSLGMSTVPNQFVSNNVNYNVIQFKSVDVYGSFPLNIAKVFNAILLKGVKFWYKEDFSEDTYVVG